LVVRDERLRTTFADFVGYRLTTETFYNSAVNAPVPPKPAADDKHQHHHTIYAAEATGLLLMAVLLLILTIVRYWRYIPWSAR